MTPAAALVSQLPSHWTSARLGQLARIVNGGTPTPDEGNWEGKIPFITPPDIRRYSGQAIRDTERTLTLEGVQSGSTLVEDGVILSTRAPIGLVARVDRPSAFNQGCRVLTSGRLEPRYLTYALLASSAALEALGQGTTFMELSTGALRSFRVPVPSGRHQVEIANFLDRETAKIDALIDKQRLLSDGLAERRAAGVNRIIGCASGKGGVPLRELAVIQTGITLGKSGYGPDLCEYPYLRVANVQVGRVDINDLTTVEVPVAEAQGAMLRRGDVLMTEGGDRAALGRGSLWDAPVDPCLHQNHVFAVRPRLDRLLPEYLVYVLEADGARRYFESTRRQTTNLSSTNSRLVRAFRFTLPSVQEQANIVRSLDTEIERIETAQATLRRAIAVAQERRVALIGAAVTGQLDLSTGKVA